MAAAASDLFMEVGVPGTATTLSAPGYTIGNTSITVASTTNWPTATGVAFAIDRVDSNGVRIDGTYCEFVGTVSSGTSITNITKTFGDAQNYAAGSTTRVYVPVTGTRENRLVQGMAVQHKQNGTHADVITTNAINENTSNNGVTIDGLHIKDGFIQYAGAPIQIVSTNYSAVATGTTVIPFDDTIPQITEGTEFMTQVITPKATTNKLVIEATFTGSYSAVTDLIAALFQDATANALAAAVVSQDTAGFRRQVTLRHVMTANTTSATTFRIRAGGSGAGTLTFNGNAGGRNFGGITMSNITITEYKA